MRVLVLTVACVTLCADVAQSQIIRPVRRFEPVAWTSLTIGFLQQQGLCDPGSDSCWDFGSALQWRATFEYPVANGASVGVAGSMARIPLIYHGQPLTEGSCFECDADANISQVLLTFRIGGGSGLHQVIDLAAGYTFFHNFRSTAGDRLGPESAVNDFTFMLGYGLGYNLGRRAQFILVQDLGLLILGRESGTAENVAQQRTTRIGARLALGTK